MSNKALAPSVVTSRDPKGLKFVSIVESAYNKARLADEEAQRVNDTSGLAELIDNFIAENRVTDKYKDEEAKSNYEYPSEYCIRPIDEQIAAIAKIFDLDPTSALEYAQNLPELPQFAEGWFAVPSPQAIARKHFPKVTDPADQYCKAIQLVHTKIKGSRKFYNYREGQIVPAQLRLSARTKEALEQINQTQSGDILIIAAQLGLRHRGRSVRRAREVFVTNEYGLGSLLFGAILLTHPNRLVRWEQLHADMAGDEFSGSDGAFDGAPFFYFGDGGVRFGTRWLAAAHGRCGSASGFLPQ